MILLEGFLNNQWVRLTLILLAAMLVVKVMTKIVFEILKQIAAKTPTEEDDILIAKLENPVVVVAGLFVIQWGMNYLDFAVRPLLERVLDSAVIVVIAFGITRVFDLTINFWAQEFAKKTKSDLDDQLVRLFERTTDVVVYAIAVLYILYTWDVQIWPLLGSLGIAGIAIAFALQETLKNIFGGIELILDKNIKTGDIIELSTGVSGKVHDITIRSTRIRTWDNKLIIIPNSVMANDVITNISKPDHSRRITVEFSVAYGTKIEKVKKIVLQEIKKIKNVDIEKNAPRVLFRKMGDSGLHFEAFYWVRDLSYFLDAREDGTTRIYDRLNKEKIEIPFPQTQVWLKKKR